MVNMMSNKEDWSLQCQEPGHIVCHCPHTRCHECDEYNHIIIDCPHRIPPSGTLVPHHKAYRNYHTRLSSRHHWEDPERSDQSRLQSRHCSSCHHDLHRGCSRSLQLDRHSHHSSRSRWSHSAHQGHGHRSCHDTPHWSHCKSSTHHSSSGYHSQDQSRSHSWPIHDHGNIVHLEKDHAVGDHTPTKETKGFTSGGVRRSR